MPIAMIARTHPSHKSTLLDLLDRPIAYHRIFVELTGSVLAAVMLSQAFYWSRRTKDPDGWFWKTREEWEEETGLKRGEQDAARKRLRATGFWTEERRGLPARMYFKLDLDRLAEQLLGHQAPTWTVAMVLEQDATYLQRLSKSAYMRARKAHQKQASLRVEYVDYVQVLEAKGMTCGICGHPITQPVGMAAGHLAFDYLVPLDQGGPHACDNLQPAHGDCHRRKVDKPENPQRNHQYAYHKPTDRLPVNPLDGLPETHQTAYPAPTITEITSEMTTETPPPPAPPQPPASISETVGEVADDIAVAQGTEATTTDGLMAGPEVTPFVAFADAYPHHQGRRKAHAEWDRQQLDATLPDILAALSVTHEGALPQWPHVYLENKGWLDARHRPDVWPTMVVDGPRCCQCDEAPGILSTRRCDVHAREKIRQEAVELCQIAGGGQSRNVQDGLTRVLEDLHPGQSERFMAAIDWAQPQTVDTVATIIEDVQQQVIRQARSRQET